MPYTIIGGRLSPPLDLKVCPVLPVSDEIVQRNIANTEALGLPTYREFKTSAKRLAVVGGGLGIIGNVEKIRAFDGEIWGVNGAWGWLREQGIEATFFAVDPHPIVANWAANVKKAILETRVDPIVFQMLKDAEVKTFDLGMGKDQIKAGSSAVTAVPYLATMLGYTEVTLFGCESSYMPQATHAYQHEERPEQLIIVCDGQEWLTAPDFYQQAIELALFINTAPDFLKEESGGLLRALIHDPKHSIKWVSEGLAATMSEPVTQEVYGAER